MTDWAKPLEKLLELWEKDWKKALPIVLLLVVVVCFCAYYFRKPAADSSTIGVQQLGDKNQGAVTNNGVMSQTNK